MLWLLTFRLPKTSQTMNLLLLDQIQMNTCRNQKSNTSATQFAYLFRWKIPGGWCWHLPVIILGWLSLLEFGSHHLHSLESLFEVDGMAWIWMAMKSEHKQLVNSTSMLVTRKKQIQMVTDCGRICSSKQQVVFIPRNHHDSRGSIHTFHKATASGPPGTRVARLCRWWSP